MILKSNSYEILCIIHASEGYRKRGMYESSGFFFFPTALLEFGIDSICLTPIGHMHVWHTVDGPNRFEGWFIDWVYN